MKAIIKQFLSKKSHSGRTCIVKTIIARKDNIVEVVNNYITERISKDNYIPVIYRHIENN